MRCVGAGCLQSLAQQSYAELFDGRYDSLSSSSSGCVHTLCMTCFSSAQGQRSANIKIICPGKKNNKLCCYSSRKWRVHSFVPSGRPTRPSPVEHSIHIPASEEDRRRHPVLYYQHLPPPLRAKYSVLTFCTADPNKADVTRSYAACLRHDERNQEIERRDLEGLGAIGRGLHSCLQPPADHVLFSEATDAFAGSKSIRACEAQDDTPMRHFYHGIATGKPFMPAWERGGVGTYEQKELNTTFVSADLSQTAKGGGPGGAS